MAKKIHNSNIQEAFERLSEIASNRGKHDAKEEIKKTLEEWNGMDDLLRRKDASLKDVVERWKRVQKSTSGVLYIIASVSSSENNVTTASATASKKAPRSASCPSSSSESSSESGGSDPGECSSDESDSDTESRSSSDASAQHHKTGSESDVATSSASAPPSSKVSSQKPPVVLSSSSSSSDSDSDSGPNSSILHSNSDLDCEEPQAKRRKIRGNEVSKAPTTTGSIMQVTPTSTPFESNRQGGKQPRKSNAPFRRIKAESVQFADERLKDNSFHSRGANRGDYGERAHADLIVTRGNGFRKEKNKKKRGSYRGGEITLGTHSIKFT